MKITLIAGARPNFMKIAPIIRAMQAQQKKGSDLQYRLVHTGQHYDRQMSETFFDELHIPLPHVNLNCGGGSHTEQTAKIMLAFEQELLRHPTDLVIVVGDVNSTMACTLVAKKMHTQVAHVEAGIRSFDLHMPEEINRMVTDSISDYFFTTSTYANENLKKAGIEPHRIFFVGNVMIDTLLKHKNRFIKPVFFDAYQLNDRRYFVLTIHRPANVDEPEKLQNLLMEITTRSGGLPVIFPVHPRTEKMLSSTCHIPSNLLLVKPMGYLEFNFLVQHAKAVITDSGGITEETTVMGIPCITLRSTTERPETISIGTNELVGDSFLQMQAAMGKILAGQWKGGSIPPLWDGKAAKRIVNHILTFKLAAHGNHKCIEEKLA